MCNTSLWVYPHTKKLHHISIETWRGIAQPYQNLQGKQYFIWGNLQTPWAQLFWFGLLEGYYSCLELLNSHALPFLGYPIKPTSSITYILEFGRVLHSLAKPRRQAIPTSFCNNIVNHGTKENVFKFLFHAHYMMPNILIQENEGIVKFFTLMLEGPLEQSEEI